MTEENLKQLKDELENLSIKDYLQLKKDSYFLACLEGAGVDNWDGTEYAIEQFEEVYPDGF